VTAPGVSRAEHLALVRRVEEVEELLEAVRDVLLQTGTAVREVVGTTQETLGGFDERLGALEGGDLGAARLARRVSQLTDAVATHLLQRSAELVPAGAPVQGPGRTS
jgi:hypothetical protein